MDGHQDLDAIWNRCFELAWQAHLEGSNPIAALVVDSNGEVVASGKSAVRGDVSDVFVSHREIAHAEVNAQLPDGVELAYDGLSIEVAGSGLDA